jgi:hypothetical protein
VPSDPTERFRIDHPLLLNAWAVTAAFGTYFCMYMYRKPFTAASYSSDGWENWDQKAILVASQVVGYMLSKIIGIRIVSEVSPSRRAALLMCLILVSHVALLLFAVVPSPWHVLCIFLNGLPLGIVFGLVLGFLEGRRMTEALTAGLCASFILAGGVSKTVGQRVLQYTQSQWDWSLGESERWMPFLAGMIFLAPIAIFIWMLQRIPPPNALDEAARSKREPMSREDRLRVIKTYSTGLGSIAVVYLLVTIMRSFRDDFAPEILQGLGASVKPDAYASIDFWVALIVMLVNGASVFIKDNRKALMGSLGVSAAGFMITMMTIGSRGLVEINPQLMMVFIGAGLYLPYVAVHTTIFERMIALTRDRANLGFLMYLADALGYCGYVVLMLLRNLYPRGVHNQSVEWTNLFLGLCGFGSAISILLVGYTIYSFSRKDPHDRPPGISILP